MSAVAARLRRILDGIYLGCGIIAAICLVAILVLVSLQMLARWTGEIFPGSSDYAGYFMAASTFFAFAYALNHGSHIRVNLLLRALGRHRRWAEIWCFVVGSVLALLWARFAFKAVYWSWKLGDISQGLDATPIWIPQIAMAVGSSVLAIALIDNLIMLLFRGTHMATARTVEDLSE